ncbi:hypothetical protein GXW78_20660 [Roseomonas terrae]|uniref:Transglutaminase-like domain-containing protein n=1 Tax=Neoroseomonas terrae TaxID=424799 RepID=A0ABS5EM27_9PROT|nr:transglutaminase domain-containing protein [Neoroseomonas terrae]MBR0652081.1 hypothetical protein [Neoroseomonas terrae]
MIRHRRARLLPRLLLSAVMLLPGGPAWSQALPAPGVDAPRMGDLNPFDLLAGLEEAAGRERGMERDIAALAARLATPQAAFVFLRDRIAIEAYPGAMRGALGALLAGAGNAADRALLLAALLEAQGVTTRFAMAELDNAVAAPLLDRATAASRRLPEPRSMLWEAVRRRAAADEAALREAALDQLGASIQPQALRAAALADLRRHVWVEAEIGGSWQAFDSSLPDAMPGEALAEPTGRHATLPDAWHQRLTLRVVAEYAEAGRLRRETVLEHGMPAEQATRARLALFFQPMESGAGGVLGRAMGLARFRPLLAVNDAFRGGEAITVSGTAPSGGGGFGALLGALDSAPAEGAELSGLFLEAVQEAPGEAPLVSTRILLDRLDAAARQAADAGSDQAPSQLAPLAAPRGRPAGFDAVHIIHAFDGAHDLVGWARAMQAVAGEAVVRFLEVPAEEGAVLALPPQEALLLHSVAWRALPILSDLLAVPAVNDRADLRAYAARPRLLVVSTGDTTDGEGIALTTDLLQDRLRVLPGPGVTAGMIAERQLRFGALQAALEIEMAATAWATLAEHVPPEILTPTGQGRLRPARPEDANGIALARLLASGGMGLIAAGDTRPTLFWEIDPATGATRAVAEPGLGAGRVSVPVYRASYEGAVQSMRADMAARANAWPTRAYTVDMRGNVLEEALENGQRIARRLDRSDQLRRAATTRIATNSGRATSPVAGEYVSVVEVVIENSAVVAGGYALFVSLSICWGLFTLFEALAGRI